MRKLLLTAIIGLFALGACDSEDPIPVEPIIDPAMDGNLIPEEPDSVFPSKDEVVATSRTVLVYIAAENSLAHFAATDISEMVAGMQGMDTDLCNLLVYVDDTQAPRLLRLANDKTGTIQKETVKAYDEQDSADPTVMQQVLKDAVKAYPAKSYGLVLWSHGEGWLPSDADTKARSTRILSDQVTNRRWWAIDNNANSTSNSGSYMDIAELAQALSSSVHFDFILFDSCFMLSAEVVYELKDYADYFIGSPAEIPGPGVNYDQLVPFFFDAHTRYAERLAYLYFLGYYLGYDPNVSTSNDNWTGGVAIGCVSSSALDDLAAATARVLPIYIKDGSTPVYSSVMTYDLRTANVYYHDLKDFIHQLTATDAATYQQWLTAFDEAMVYWGTTPTVYSAFGRHTVTMSDYTGGLSLFIPRYAKSDLLPAFRQLKWYTAAGWDDTGW
jgi:hypothetical protein